MGQINGKYNGSTENIVISETLSVIQDEIMRQGRLLAEIANLSYEDFQLCIKQLNELSKKVTDHNGKQLLFSVKKGTDSTLLWKKTVRIACIKIDPETRSIESHRLFSLNQFLRIFKTLECQLIAALQSSENEMTKSSTIHEDQLRLTSHLTSKKSSDSDSVSSDDSVYCELDTSKPIESKNSLCENSVKVTAACSETINQNLGKINYLNPECSKFKKLTASILLQEVDNLTNDVMDSVDKLGECCICLERKLDVILPCTHAFCMPCIEEWNTLHKTCPFCRETLECTDDTWVISDIPASQEIGEEICSGIMDFTSPG